MILTIRLASLASAAVKTKPNAGPHSTVTVAVYITLYCTSRTPAMAPFDAEINNIAGRGMQRYSSWAE